VNESEYKVLLTTLRTRQFVLMHEISELEMRKADMDKEMANVKATIAKLQPLCGETPDPDDLSGLGFTDAVRKVIYLSGKQRISPNEIKDALEQKGFSLSGYSNPMASIYTILTRLHKQDELEPIWEGLSVFYKAKPKKLMRRRLGRLRVRNVRPAVEFVPEKSKE
jgi:hypothetical protein